jgi:hypothetical protein
VHESMSSMVAGNEPGATARAVAAPAGTRLGTVFRALCILTAIANMGGNALLLVAHEPVFRWLGLPVPDDLYTFSSVLGFSFTSGVVALMIALRPAHAVSLLVVAIVGKALFAFTTLAFHVRHRDRQRAAAHPQGAPALLLAQRQRARRHRARAGRPGRQGLPL